LCKSFEHLIGIPFVDGGRTIEEGLDCFGLFILANKEYGKDIPDFKISCYDSPKIAFQAMMEIQAHWEKIEQPEEGCGVAFAIDPTYPGLVQHFGIYIGDNRVLHTIKKAESSTIRIDHPYWKNKIVGYYRWKNAKN